jgi:hypothetical protein
VSRSKKEKLKKLRIPVDALLDEQEGGLIYMQCLSAMSKLCIVAVTSGVPVIVI